MTAQLNGAKGYAHHSNTVEWIIQKPAVLTPELCVCNGVTKPTVQLQEETKLTHLDQPLQLCVEYLPPKSLQGLLVVAVDSLGL